MTLVSAVNAPAITKPKHNLVSSGHLVPISTDKWEGGVSFTPRGCYQIEGACATCPPQSKEELQTCIEAVTFMPYILDLGVSLYAPDREEVNAFAEDDLDVGSSSRLESLIWAGCEGVDNPILTDGEALTVEGSTIAGLGAMIAELISATGHGGAMGTIHMSPILGVELSQELYRDGDDLRTKIGDHLVIIGNYPTDIIIGHVGNIDVYLGDPFHTAGKDQLMRKNLTELRWERLALATWNTCAIFKVSVGED